MFNLKFRYLFFVFSSSLLEFFTFFLIPIEAEDFKKFESEIQNPNFFKKDSSEFKKLNHKDLKSKFRSDLKEDLFDLGNNLIFLIISDEEVIRDNYSLDIESDIQYEIDNKYYAEGNSILYFSNSILKSDKLIYDKSNKTLTFIGNVIFNKGSQYFEASKVFYDLKKNEGYIDNIYGILDFNDFIEDFEFKNIKEKEDFNLKDIENLNYVDSVDIGLANNFEEDKRLNITNIEFDIPSITKWRYKSNKIILKDEILKSENILFTNDALNKPQFFIQSKNFTGEIIDDKVKLISRKSWIILDNKLKIPIGRRTIYDSDPITSWAIGSDYENKDGFYLYRSFKPLKVGKEFDLKITPYFLFQRAIKGNTNAFTARNESLLSGKINNDINTSDIFALDLKLRGKVSSWDLDWRSKFNTLNPDWLSQSVRTKLILQKSYDLNNSKLKNNNTFLVKSFELNDSKNLDKYAEKINYESFKKDNTLIDRKSELSLETEKESKEVFENFLDIKFSTVFREDIPKVYSGNNEIYFGNSLALTNRRFWKKGEKEKNLYLIYNLGKFKAKSKNTNDFKYLFRNVFAVQLNHRYPIWQKKLKYKTINKDYKFSPTVIKEGISWITNIQSGYYLYSNGTSQEAVSFSLGPQIILGSFRNHFFDYSSLNISGNYVLKNGESPFSFDDINDNFRLNLKLEQQIIGPLVASYETNYDFDTSNFSKPIYTVDVKRRAYKIGGFYNVENKILGFRFDIYNFNYSGQSSKF